VLRVIWLLSVIRVIRLLVMQLVFACGFVVACGCLWLLVFASGRLWLLVVACGWLLVVLSVIHLPGG
jgi:hypothetical protein